MKKTITLLLAMLILLFLAACRGETPSDNHENQPTEKPDTTTSIANDSRDLEVILSFIATEGESAADEVATAAETLLVRRFL